MKTRCLLGIVLLLVALAPIDRGALAGPVPSSAPACSRACLRGLADRLLDAMVAHDPAAAPMAASYVATENSVPSALGLMSAWRTASSVTQRYYVVDPDSAQVFWMGTLREGSFDSLTFGRLKADGPKISEVEAYVSRSRGQGGFMFSAGGAANFPMAWTQKVPKQRLPSRADLLAAGRSIFDARVDSPPVSDACILMEDGRVVGEDPKVLEILMGPEQALATSAPRNPDGSVQIPCGSPPERPTDSQARTDIADTEQGVVISIATVSGVAEPYVAKQPTESAFVPDSLLRPYLGMLDRLGSRIPAEVPRVRPLPASQVVVELHRVYDGKVQGMLMLHSTQAPGARSSWVASVDRALPPKLVAGSTWVVEHTSVFDGLIIPKDVTVVAPAPRTLTMTVDGVETPIQAGAFQGKVVLTVGEDIPVDFEHLPTYHYRAALYVDGDRVAPERSVAAAVTGGQVTDGVAKDVLIRSTGDRFNGILVAGKSHYRIEHADIDFSGNGGNDFAGFGAAVMSTDDADVTLEHSKIVTRGAIRTALFVGGHSTMHVDDTTIDVSNGTLPADYKFNIDAGRMMEVPWMLGLVGNVRATNLVDSGTLYLNRSHIRSQGWGALSTDGPRHLRMYAQDSTIETVDSGYGAYSIGDSIDRFSHCRFDVADVALIVAANGSGTFTDQTIVNSRRFGVMMHSGVGGGLLTIEKGSVFNTRSTAIQVKGRGANILIDDASINAGNGILLQAMVNDDPMAPKQLPPSPASAGDSAASDIAPVSSDVVATLRNVALRGDIVDSRTTQGEMSIALEGAQLQGAVTTATAVPSTGAVPTQKTYYLIGDVRNTHAPSSDAHGLALRLDGRSRWVVTKSSFLTALVLAKGATITAAKDQRVELFVDGSAVPMAAGSYSGRIELRVTAR